MMTGRIGVLLLLIVTRQSSLCRQLEAFHVAPSCELKAISTMEVSLWIMSSIKQKICSSYTVATLSRVGYYCLKDTTVIIQQQQMKYICSRTSYKLGVQVLYTIQNEKKITSLCIPCSL